MYAADEKGYVYVIDIYAEQNNFNKKLVKDRINKLEIIQESRFLIVSTDCYLKSYKVKKGVLTRDLLSHTEAILNIEVIEPSKVSASEEEKVPAFTKVITASYDNSILLWDYEKLEVMTRMEAPRDSELSCMTFLPKSCLVATGHEQGAIRLWNLEIQTSVLL